jgi:hypothetical protein
MNNGWRPIEFKDVPLRLEFEELTLNLLRKGVTGTDRMRQEISSSRRLIRSQVIDNMWDTPSGKFVNEHAWVLGDLVVRHSIQKITDKEYRLI